MKSKVGIVFISIIIALLVIILALSINHMVCQKGDAHQTLIDIDTKVTNIINSVKKAITDFFDYCKYLYLKVTAIQTLEYPADNLPLYPDSRVTDYSFNNTTNSLYISSGTTDSFDSIYKHYSSIFSNDITVDYFKQYNINNQYIAYGMIGNFTFLLEAIPSNDEKYTYTINTKLHYLIGNELEMENFFRQQKASNSYIFTNPYIYMYQIKGDDKNLRFQLRDYKSRLLNLDTHVELYINDEFYTSRYYGDTIIVPIDVITEMKNIKMISFDNNDCVRAIDIIENTVFYDAYGQDNLYDLAEKHNKAKNLFLINTDNIADISYFNYFSNLESLYFEGNDKIKNYSSMLYLKNLSKLYLKNVGAEIFTNLHQFENLKVLEITDCQSEIALGEAFSSLQCIELSLSNCPNITFTENGLFSNQLEKLSITYNYSIDSIGFISVYPNLHIIDLSNCDDLSTLMNTNNLPNLNMLTIDNCQKFDLSQPLDNNNSLIYIKLSSNPSFAQTNSEFLHSIWVNNSIVFFEVSNCINTEDILYSNKPWEKVN